MNPHWKPAGQHPHVPGPSCCWSRRRGRSVVGLIVQDRRPRVLSRSHLGRDLTPPTERPMLPRWRRRTGAAPAAAAGRVRFRPPATPWLSPPGFHARSRRGDRRPRHGAGARLHGRPPVPQARVKRPRHRSVAQLPGREVRDRDLDVHRSQGELMLHPLATDSQAAELHDHSGSKHCAHLGCPGRSSGRPARQQTPNKELGDVTLIPGRRLRLPVPCTTRGDDRTGGWCARSTGYSFSILGSCSPFSHGRCEC